MEAQERRFHEAFTCRKLDHGGCGDDEHGWAADGFNQKRWHNGPEDAVWPRTWRRGDVICCAVNFAEGLMRFSPNGDWVENAEMRFIASGRKLLPAVSMSGGFIMHIPQGTWQFTPPDDGYHPCASTGVFIRSLNLTTEAESEMSIAKEKRKHRSICDFHTMDQ